MRVLVLGGTGSIGGPVVRELVGSGHEVLALARSPASTTKLLGLGARPIPGDLREPERWIDALPPLDGVIQAAAAFADDDEAVERRLLDRLLPHVSATPARTRVVYTGGCWLYGENGEEGATSEESPFDPLPALAWGVAHAQRVLATPGILPIVIHPAMVYEARGGVFGRFLSDATTRGRVRIVGSANVRWPLVHSEDLATLYRLALERSELRENYLGAAIDAIPVSRIARAYARRFGTPSLEPEIVSGDEIAAELGPWARGYALDQRQSGDKARRRLGWDPQHLDPEAEIAALA